MIQEKKISDFAEVITGGTPSTTKKNIGMVAIFLG